MIINCRSRNSNNQKNLCADLSPNLQHITNNHPTSNIKEPICNYDNASTDPISHATVQSNDATMPNTKNAVIFVTPLPIFLSFILFCGVFNIHHNEFL